MVILQGQIYPESQRPDRGLSFTVHNIQVSDNHIEVFLRNKRGEVIDAGIIPFAELGEWLQSRLDY